MSLDFKKAVAELGDEGFIKAIKMASALVRFLEDFGYDVAYWDEELITLRKKKESNA